MKRTIASLGMAVALVFSVGCAPADPATAPADSSPAAGAGSNTTAAADSNTTTAAVETP